MTIKTYRMHTQLMKALVVQMLVPFVLFAIPIVLTMAVVIFQLDLMDDMVKLTEVAMSLHSTANSFAVLLLIAPYRRAVLHIFHSISSKYSLSTPVSSVEPQNLY
ncbi:hypothetical protein QR680_015610 [Steinernema hermaphroditum]|uniref:G protein-coupled receptor n=1 Tax=Steinernema hermaphroditum TaxID=289476 RepID=A0AA39H9G6_9BILA|nr:hypothetical protein QR680_015610 [Steinernema hermaphroditum]